MTRVVTHHSDVRFLDDCDPALIERNAAEFARMRDLLASVEPDVRRARDRTVWESVHREHFESRLADAHGLVTGLAEGFGAASTALLRYADAVERARQVLRDGVEAEARLDQLVSTVAHPFTRAAQEAEPMRRWEDLTSTTGFLDWLAELFVHVERIREPATRAYEQADEAFGRARAIEAAARAECLGALRAAQRMLPDFRGGDFADLADVVGRVEPLRDEVAQARDDPLVRLPGSGETSDAFPAGDAAVSPALQHVRDLLQGLPDAHSPWQHEWFGGGNDDDRARWIRDNRELVLAAAAENGLPPDMVAGIAWQEVGGKPYVLDDVTDAIRHAAQQGWSPLTPGSLPGPLAGDPDNTSYGPMAVQVRRAAEVLGYDPHHLTDQQRAEITSAVKDPAQNLFVAARYLADLKAESGFADVPADRMTPEQYQELAARYNGGPYWRSQEAQAYGREFAAHRQQAADALR